MKRIKLTQGQVALVDNDDYDKIKNYRWYASKNNKAFYAHSNKDGKKVLMHRLIMGAKKGQQIDHINHNGIDNRRKNLRVVNQNQNAWNRREAKGYAKAHGKWQASIKVFNRVYGLGAYKTKEEASAAYKGAKRVRDKLGEALKGDCADAPPCRSDDNG